MECGEGSSTSDVSGGCSESTLELNIKTLDSRIYSIHVDNNMVVSAFKEKIASQSGVPVAQQRLIFRGKVLNDDHLLSEYHVENGDTLNLGEAGEAASPDMSQVIGGILNSIGIGSLGGAIQPGGGVMQPGVQASHGNDTEASRNNAGQLAPHAMQIPLGASVPIPTLNMPISDSLDMLIDFMNRMELSLSQSGNQPNQSSASSDQQPTTQLPRSSRGVPTIEALSIALRQAQHLLSSHVVPALSNTAGRLDQLGGLTDPSVREHFHIESAQLGVAMQQLGALLPELGRTILTLCMGQYHAESFVNAEPAVYIFSSGPNPIMVQPFPLQTSALFSGLSGAPPNPMFVGPIGAGSISRNVNIHIHIGASLAPLIPRVVDGTQGQSTSGTEPGNSAQAPISSTAIPLRPAVIPVFGAVSPDTSVPQASDSNPNSSMVAQLNSQLRRNLTSNLQNGNNAISGQSEGSTDQGLSAGGVGDNDRNSPRKDFPTSGADETSQTLCRGSDIKETEDTNSNREISISAPERAENLESHARPNQGSNSDSSSSGGDPLVLGLGGLQPKKRVKQPEGQNKNSDNASTCIQNSGILGSVPTRRQTVDTPIDMADAMSRVLEDPTMNGLLSGLAQETGFGSPDMFRNILQQFTRNPTMRNTVNQIDQQIDSLGLGDMTADLGRGGEGGGIDLLRTMQQMMPMVAQALGGGVSSAPLQITGPMENVISESRSRREAGRVDNDPQIDLGQVVERLENQSCSQEIFRSVGDSSGILGSVPARRETADTPIDMADSMSQLNGFLSDLAEETGVDSLDMIRNMLQQFARNPTMRNTVNQIDQQIDSHGLGDTMADLGRGGEGGGIDLSRMMQQMMPMVAQASGGDVSSAPQITNPMENMISEVMQLIEQINEQKAQMNEQIIQMNARTAEQMTQNAQMAGEIMELFNRLRTL